MCKIIKTHIATKKNFNMINGNSEKLETCRSAFFRLEGSYSASFTKARVEESSLQDCVTVTSAWKAIPSTSYVSAGTSHSGTLGTQKPAARQTCTGIRSVCADVESTPRHKAQCLFKHTTLSTRIPIFRSISIIFFL